MHAHLKNYYYSCDVSLSCERFAVDCRLEVDTFEFHYLISTGFASKDDDVSGHRLIANQDFWYGCVC